jgi:hypothetical protein
VSTFAVAEAAGASVTGLGVAACDDCGGEKGFTLVPVADTGGAGVLVEGLRCVKEPFTGALCGL